ncbi:hypothetical protein MJ049_06105 [Acinetobacter baumannii]|nr:hypothetical protein [Acinetobacter baumannii]MDA3581851.1 hypothetical protein [Acinetobacter baumannii]
MISGVYFNFVIGIVSQNIDSPTNPVRFSLIVSGFFKTLLNSLIYRFERPKRIKTQDGFLYFFKGKYYPLEYRNKLIDEHRKKFKHLSL